MITGARQFSQNSVFFAHVGKFRLDIFGLSVYVVRLKCVVLID